MKSKRRWFFGLALTFPLVILLLVLSSMQLASADTGQADVPHWFYGHLLDMSGADFPAEAVVEARDDAGGVIWTGIDGNPITMPAGVGVYGCTDPDHPSITDFNLAVQGAAEDMYEGLPISFYVNDKLAEVRECGSTWAGKTTYPWKSDRKTCLDLRAESVPPGYLTVTAGDCCTVTVEGEDPIPPGGGPPPFEKAGDVELSVITEGECCSFNQWTVTPGGTFTETTILVHVEQGQDKTVVADCTVKGPFNLTVNQVNYYSGDPFVDPDLVILDPEGGVYDCCTYVTATAVLTHPAWEFMGWDADFPLAITDTEFITTHMIADREITATFAPISATFPLTITSEEFDGRTACYTIEVTGVLTPGIVAPGEVKEFVAQSGLEVVLTAITGECCGFAGWYEDGVLLSEELTYSYMPGSGRTIVGQSYLPPFFLTTAADPAGSGDVTREPDDLGAGYGCEAVTVTAHANITDHWEFDGWLGDLMSMESPDQIDMDGDKMVTATFTLETFTVTIDIEPIDGGTVTETEETEDDEYEWGETITLTAEPAVCYDFVEWTGLPAGIPTDTLTVVFTVTGELDIGAVFARDMTTYTLTVNVVSGGVSGAAVIKDPDQAVYTCCTYVTLTPTATQAYDKVTWSGHPDVEGITNTAVIVHILDGNVEVTATFEAGGEPPPILVGHVGPGSFVGFDNVTLTVRFVGVGDVVVDVDANGYFTVPADAIVIAPGTYNVGVKELRTLAICQTDLALPAAAPVDFIFDASPQVPTWDGDLYQGDLNGDNTINMLDFSTWAGIFNGGVPLADKRGDINNDSNINMLDFSAWAGKFNGGQPPAGAPCWTQ